MSAALAAAGAFNPRPSDHSGLVTWLQAVVREQAANIARARRNVASGLKSWVIVEPTERETRSADEAMTRLFHVGSDQLVRTRAQMDTWCADRHDLLLEAATWVVRKYTFHLGVRVLTSAVLSRARDKLDLYCADHVFRENFVNFSSGLAPFNARLTEVRARFQDTLVAVQTAVVGITKVGALCCGFWRFREESVLAVAEEEAELRSFLRDLIDSWFLGAQTVLCLAFQERSIACKAVQGAHSAHVHERQSLLMNLVDATAKISDVAL